MGNSHETEMGALRANANEDISVDRLVLEASA